MSGDLGDYWQKASQRYSDFSIDLIRYLEDEISQCAQIKNYSLETGMVETGARQMTHFNRLPLHQLVPKSIRSLLE